MLINLLKEEIKGREGEKQVEIYLNYINGYKQIINDIILNDNGKTRQIDHIAITEYGVFVIETKNLRGSIYGKDDSNEWKQWIGGKEFRFKNPRHQNYGHVKIVEKILSDYTDKIYSIVAFNEGCKLKCHVSKGDVMYNYRLQISIESKPKVLSIEQIENIYEILMNNRVTNQEYIANHNYNVRQYIKYKERQADNGICPRCNGKLVIRNGKDGQFYGCSNFPKCRYTLNINNEVIS